MTRDEIKNSVEARFFRARMWLFLIFYFLIVAVLAIVFLGRAMFSGPEGAWVFLLSVGVFGLCFIPFIVFYLYRWLALFHHPEHYAVYTVHFALPEGNSFLTPRFSFELTLHNGEKVNATTHGVFVFFSNSQETAFYTNQDVKIGYDSRHGRVVVLGLVSAGGQARSKM